MKNLLIMFFCIISLLLVTGCQETSMNKDQIDDKIIDNSSVNNFSELEISNAKELIEKYFKAKNEKDTEKIIECYHPSRLSIEDVEEGKIILFGKEDNNLIKIHEYDSEFSKPFVQNILGKFEESNILVLKVDYEISYPDGGEEDSLMAKGLY